MLIIIQNICAEYFLRAWSWARCWGCDGEQEKHWPIPYGAFVSGRQTNHVKNK